MTFSRLAIGFLAIFSPFFSIAQSCQYLAYEPFDYSPGMALEASSEGSGWLEPWFVQNNDVVTPGYQIASANPLQYSDLQQIGNYAVGGRAYIAVGRRLDTRQIGAFANYVTEDQYIGAKTGTTLWLSAVLRKENNNSEAIYWGMHDSQLSWCDGCTQKKVLFGYFGSPSDVGGQKRWTLRIGDNYFPTGIPVSIGQASLLVMKIQFNADNTQIDCFVNPSGLGNATPTPVLSQTTNAPFWFRSFMMYLGNNAGNGSIDEIRFAPSYACVAPDNTVSVDLPPVPQFTASALDGTAPFSVTFNGSSSYDPEGMPLTYAWNFGDGTPVVESATVNHTFNALGILPVKLTVKDPSGQEGVYFQNIKVRNVEGSFPCQTHFSLLEQAGCNGQPGRLLINNGPANFSLTNANGVAQPLVNTNQFQNLAAGIYVFEAFGNDGCHDKYTLRIPIDSTTCAGWQADTCNMAIGTNLSGLADWVSQRPLRNLMKHVRPQFIVYDDACFCWDNGHLADVEADSNGYPIQIPQLVNGISNKVRYMISSGGYNLPPGHSYVLLYNGVGELTVKGGAVETSKTPGRIQFDVVAAENLFFCINSSMLGNHVRNIRILRIEDENSDYETQPFYQGFLDKTAPFKALRFMDWGATNGNPMVHWDERTDLTHFTYGTPTGVPYETMIQLANYTGKDVWICVPHAADSNFVAQMAKLFRDNLNPGLKIYLEYSNEVWNWIFDQAHYNLATTPANINYGRGMALKAGKTFKIWYNVFGSDTSRVKRVLGLQATYNYLNEHIMAQLDPSEWDYGAPTSYIGLDHGATGNPVLNAGSTGQDVVENARNNWHATIPLLRQDYNNIKLFGKEIVNYEGGQHFVGNVFGIGYPYQQALYDAQYTEDIYHLYDDMLDTVRNWGSRMFGNFSLAGEQESIYGSWGVLNDIDVQEPYLMNAPKYKALIDNVCSKTEVSGTQSPHIKLVMEVFPNPTSDVCAVRINSKYAETTVLRLLDLSGKTVITNTLKLSTGQNATLLDLSQLPSGMYWVNVQGAGTQSVVVQH